MQTQVKWLVEKMIVISQKLQCLEVEYLQKTYSPTQVTVNIDSADSGGNSSTTLTLEPVQALTYVRDILTSRLTERKEYLEQLKSSVREYEAAGMGFHELAQEYAAIQKQIENKKWTLQQMQR